MLIYFAVISIRNFLFNKSFFTAGKVDVPIISIGNITVGGQGKTPAVIYLAGLLKEIGMLPGILSRGYGRKSKGYVLVSDGKKIFSNVGESGDESFLTARECQVPVAVCEKRVLGAENFIKDTKINSIILDDAFQHRWIKRDCDILLFEQRFLIYPELFEQWMLPVGVIREPLKNVDRADAIIINRKFSDDEIKQETIDKLFKGKNIFKAYYDATDIIDVKTNKHYSLSDFSGEKTFVVCGIARPFSFLNVLRKNNINVNNKLLMSDHENYSHHEIKKIRKKFYESNATSVLTTQKDAVKFYQFNKELDDIDIYYVRIEMRMDEPEEFKKFIKNKLLIK